MFELPRTIAATDPDGMTVANAARFAMTEDGRPFVHAITARFDEQGAALARCLGNAVSSLSVA
ncbi:MAG: hypothetical protein MO846_07350 [Candidatus Devosia symbiotica]|nr:hypothetical protein [Candidatus Devosia symbiotica]